MTLKVKVKVLGNPNAHTQYITIPSAMVTDSQYPLKPNQEVEVVIVPGKGKIEIFPTSG